MLIQCPRCYRTGNIPDRFGLAPHRVRCRTCEMRFWTVPLPGEEGIDRRPLPMEETRETLVVRDLAPLPSRPANASLDDDEDFTFHALGPGDSHYELTISNDDEHDDSQVEPIAFTSDDAPSSDEIAVFAEGSPSEELLIGERPHSRPTDPGGRHRVAGTVIAGALSLAILGFFVRQGILSAQTVSSSVTALIAGGIGLGGVLLLLFAMSRSPLHLLPAELAKALRRHRRRSDLDGQVASE
jgi:hypothetical protein